MKTLKYIFSMVLIAIAGITVLQDEPDLIWQIALIVALMLLGWMWQEKTGQRHANAMGKPTVVGGHIYYPRHRD